jgi:transcriptional regulator GlxA family with amidase domain
MNSFLNHLPWLPALAEQSKWSASALAKQCGVSMRTLERHFLKHLGKSPKAWLNEQRQLQAIKLLRAGSPVKAVAGAMHYKHPNHLSKDFKKFWGVCPTKLLAPGQGKIAGPPPDLSHLCSIWRVYIDGMASPPPPNRFNLR